MEFGTDIINTLVECGESIQSLGVAFWQFINGNLATMLNQLLDQQGAFGDVVQELGAMFLDQPGGLFDYSLITFIIGTGGVTLCFWAVLKWIIGIVT